MDNQLIATIEQNYSFSKQITAVLSLLEDNNTVPLLLDIEKRLLAV